jgi:hypothetical protein
MYDDYPNELAETEMLLQRATAMAIEHLLLALVIVIAGATVLALLAICIGMIGEALKGRRPATAAASSPARAIARRPALGGSRARLHLVTRASTANMTRS